MVAVVGSLVTTLQINDGLLVSGLGRAGGRLQSFERTSNTSLGRLDAKFTALGRTVKTLGTSLIGLFAGSAFLRGASQLMDTATKIGNGLRVAGLAGEELTEVYNGLRDAALKNAAPFEALATLYSRTALVQKELGVSSEDLVRFSSNVAVALRVSGQSAQEASGALLQLSQALGSGVVRAEEFNSVLEGAPTILQAAAAGIKEAEGSVAKLRTIMLDGKLSSKALFDAIQIGSAMLEEKAATATLTTAQAMENLNTRLIDVARRFNEGTNASDLMVGAIDELGDGIEGLAIFLDAIIPPLQTFIAGLQDGIVQARGLAFELARISGLDQAGFNFAVGVNNLGLGDALSVGSSAAGRVVDQTFALIGATPQDETLAAILAGNAPPAPLEIVVDGANPISINDPAYAPPAGAGKGSGHRTGTSEVEKQKKAVDDLIASLEAERAAIGMSATEARVMNELRRVGVSATSEQGQAIAHMIRTVEAETGAFERMQDALETSIGLAQDFASTLVQGFRSGRNATEILQDAVSNLMAKLAEMALNNAITSLFSMFFGGAGAGGMGANTTQLLEAA